jgi:SAM-dependent methyltransferase
MPMKKLNLGSGTDIKDGWINLDKFKLPGVDVVHDLGTLPLPFKDGEFDEILCQDILEHLDYVMLMKELYRILKTGGRLKIRVPHFTSVSSFVDPTHKNMFSFRTFEYFVKDLNPERYYYFDFSFSKIGFTRITFAKRYYFYNILIEKLINTGKITRRFYEGTFLSRLFPAKNIIIELIK